MSETKFEVLPSPVKSESDKKEYKVIKLKNGLVALLISDTISDSKINGDSQDLNESKSEKKAAASICVGVGSFSDPKEVPGLSHFLEHMVSMGSQKYPGENDFESFIQKSGGDTNAGTDPELTIFYFWCIKKHLNEALDKFAQFFIAPLMKKEAITRERESVDSEFQMNVVPSDNQREEMIMFSLAKPNSPMNFFSCGNLKTLKDKITDDKLYEKLHEYRQRHYSANRMTLTIQACLPLGILQRLVVESFSNVPNNNLPKLDFSEYARDIFNTQEFNKIYYIKPVNEITKLDLTWSLPSLKSKYRNKPVEYLGTLLGYEGKGSLLSYFKKKIWATSVIFNNASFSWFSNFSTSILLTQEGLKHVYEVIKAVFAFIKLIKNVGPQKRIFDELKMISDAKFRFSNEESSTDNAKKLSENMQFYAPQDYIGGDSLFYQYDPEVIKMVVNNLVPDKVNIMVSTKSLPDGLKFNQVEKWIGAEYVSVDIPQNMKTKWKTTEPYSEFIISPPNPYLSNEFTILPETPNNPEYPQKIMSNSKCELWYKKDQKYKLPNAYFYLYLISPASTESAKSAALSDVFLNLLKFYIGEEAYPASMANLEYTFKSGGKGIIFKVSGFHEKIPVLIDVGAKCIKNLKEKVNEKTFNEIKAKTLKLYYNKLLSPFSLARESRLKLITNYWTVLDKYNALLTTTYADIKHYLEAYIKKIYIKALVQGNVLAEVAINTINKFVDSLLFEPLPHDMFPKQVVAQLPLGEKCFNLESFNKNDANSVIINYYQIGPNTIRDNSLVTIATTILEEPLFDVLRTKEQLGYQVLGSTSIIYEILGYNIIISSQATKYTTQHLDSRIENFLKQTKKILDDISEENFKKIKEDIIKDLDEEPTQLREEVNKNWDEIIIDRYMFDRLKQKAKLLKNIKLDEVKTWWTKLHSFGKKENYRKLSVQVAGHIPDAETKTQAESTMNMIDPLSLTLLGDNKNKIPKPDCYVENIDSFKSSLSQYSST